MAGMVLLLLAIGFVGTLGHYGSLGHSPHLFAGLAVVDLVFLSAWSAIQISSARPWAPLGPYWYQCCAVCGVCNRFPNWVERCTEIFALEDLSLIGNSSRRFCGLDYGL